MTKYVLFLVSIVVFVLLWQLMGKLFKWIYIFIKRLNDIQTYSPDFFSAKILNVFTAETLTGTEAEFMNEYLPEKRNDQSVMIASHLALNCGKIAKMKPEFEPKITRNY